MVGRIGCLRPGTLLRVVLREFEPVSVKMAQDRTWPLIFKDFGQCGKLFAALDTVRNLCSLKKCLPKCGKRVHIAAMPQGSRQAEHLEGT
jgi:cell fate regulator YaaT (PSP1 superfamily)